MTDIKIKFHQLYIENYTAVYNFIFSIAFDEHISEDITQEAFIRAYNHIDSFRNESKISVWLSQIAYNLLIDYKMPVSFTSLIEVNIFKFLICKEAKLKSTPIR